MKPFQALRMRPTGVGGGGGGGLPAPLGVALNLPFAAGGPYEVDGANYAALSSVPGYFFSDGVSNIITLDAGGYESSRTNNTKLKVTAPTIGDVDFVAWIKATLSDDGGATNMLFSLANAADDYANMLLLYRAGADVTAYGRAASTDVYTTLVATIATGTVVALLRRKSGKFQTFIRKPDTTIVSTAESGAVAMPSSLTRLFVGTRFDNTAITAAIAGMYARIGTYTDAQVTTLLGAA